MSAYPVRRGGGPNHWAAQDLKLAMTLLGKNRHYQMHYIQRRHFNSTARKVLGGLLSAARALEGMPAN